MSDLERLIYVIPLLVVATMHRVISTCFGG